MNRLCEPTGNYFRQLADGDDAVVQVFFVRGGKLIGREHFYMTNVSENTDSQILTSFVKQFYAGTPFIPKELLLQVEITQKSSAPSLLPLMPWIQDQSSENSSFL